MSHTTTIKSLDIKDVRALKAAVEELRTNGVAVSLKENVRPRMYYTNQSGPCDFVLSLSGQYDVGLQKNAQGSYDVVFDEYANHVGAVLGAACPMKGTKEERTQHQIGKFLQSYAKHAAIFAANDQGYMVESCHTNEQGEVHLTLAV